jgi:hypothetical protein
MTLHAKIITATSCQQCGSELVIAPAGRRKRFCSPRCQKAHLRTNGFRSGLTYRTGHNSPKSPSQVTDLTSEFLSVNAISKKPLKFERVNEVTWKLTNGDLTNVPASHGQWGGYRTTRAVAWIINIGPGQWLARCGNQACGPSAISEAKANAMKMARGACGDYVVERPVAHLNGLHAVYQPTSPSEPHPAVDARAGSRSVWCIPRYRFSHC